MLAIVCIPVSLKEKHGFSECIDQNGNNAPVEIEITVTETHSILFGRNTKGTIEFLTGNEILYFPKIIKVASYHEMSDGTIGLYSMEYYGPFNDFTSASFLTYDRFETLEVDVGYLHNKHAKFTFFKD